MRFPAPLLLLACAPRLDFPNDPSIPLERRWVVECVDEAGERGLVLTAARPETRCQSDDFELPAPSDCDAVRAHFATCDAGTGPYATDGAILAYVPPQDLVVAGESITGGLATSMWVQQCVRGENEFGRVYVDVLVERHGDDATVEIGHEWADAEARFTATWCPAD